MYRLAFNSVIVKIYLFHFSRLYLYKCIREPHRYRKVFVQIGFKVELGSLFEQTWRIVTKLSQMHV